MNQKNWKPQFTPLLCLESLVQQHVLFNFSISSSPPSSTHLFFLSMMHWILVDSTERQRQTTMASIPSIYTCVKENKLEFLLRRANNLTSSISYREVSNVVTWKSSGPWWTSFEALCDNEPFILYLYSRLQVCNIQSMCAWLRNFQDHPNSSHFKGALITSMGNLLVLLDHSNPPVVYHILHAHV